MGVLLVRRLEVNLQFDTDNGIAVLMTGCIVLLLTVVVVHLTSLRPYNISPHSGAGSSQALGKPSYWSSCWVGIAESVDGRKQIHGSVSVSVAAQRLNYFDFRMVA